MATTAITIDGTDVTARVGRHPSIDLGLSRRGICRLTCLDRVGTWRPALFAELVITVDGTIVFGGSVLTVNGTDLVDGRGFEAALEVQDFAAYADRTLYNGVTPAGTLKAAIQVLVANLAAFGVTLGPMEDGPTIPSLGFAFQTVRAALDATTAIADPPYGWRIDASKVLHVTRAGTRPAPYPITGANGRVITASWQQTQRLYRNQQWVQFGQPGVRPYVSTWQGDGVRRDFPIIGPNLTGELWPAGTTIASVEVDGTVVPVGDSGDATVDWWYIGAPDLLIRQNPAAAVLPSTSTLRIPYDAQYPGAVFVSVQPPPAAAQIVTMIDQVTSTDDPYAAVAAGEALLRRYGITPRTATVETALLGFEPGMTVDVDLPPWDLSGTWLIETVQLRHELQQGGGQHFWRAVLTLVEGDETRGSWIDFWRREGAGSGTAFSGVSGGGGGGGDGGGGTTGGGPSPIALGGSRLAGASGAGWQPIRDWVDVLVDPALCDRYTARLDAWVVQTGTITPRIIALTAPIAVVGTGTASSATTAAGGFQEFTVTVSGLTGPNYLRAELLLSDASAEGFIAAALLYPAPTTVRRRRRT